MKRSLTPVASLGEFGLIQRLTRGARLVNASSIRGCGDDAAVLDYNNGKRVLVSSDMLIEGVHFDLSYVPLKHLGYKAITVNASDIYAMNGVPRQVTVALAVSNRFTVEALDELYAGILLACERYGIDLVGGDTTSSRVGACICVTVIGEAGEGEVTCRDSARVNDLVCVSGDLGAAYAGLQVLKREKVVVGDDPDARPALEGYEYVIERQLKPEARGDVTRRLAEAGVRPTAMIDVSDGLSSELLHVCVGSGVGCRVFEEKIPVDGQTRRVAGELNLDPVTCAMAGGEDYELLFTAPLEARDALAAMEGVSIIGYVTPPEDGRFLVTRDGALVELEARGWNSFIQRE
ncbi:MAG: thiamine-phosphate kinase [Odoribacteraceae bacterium]|jgi:thiamine-monophosphate kinase|nr:thiamine-phosphate kinase [Odoribacteraceae bacterium]